MAMKTMMTVDRMGLGNQLGSVVPGVFAAPVMNMIMNMTTMPRCKVAFEKCSTGMEMTCTSEDPTARAALQNLCDMLAGSMMSCCMMNNGMVATCFNMTMGMCTAEMTDKGAEISCVSKDPESCKMIQECCECMSTMMECGCTCCICLNNIPLCCCTL
jgi:hypothetical protein